MSRSRLPVRLLPIAESDLTEILTFIAAERPKAALELATRIEKNLGSLSSNPRLGRIPRDSELLELGYRYLILDDYLVFYTIEPGCVLVHRILHGA